MLSVWNAKVFVLSWRSLEKSCLIKVNRVSISKSIACLRERRLCLQGTLLHFFKFFSGALAREARSGAPWVKKCGKLPIRENLVIT